jgi:type II secretion system protein I
MAANRVTPRKPEGGFTLIEVMIAVLLTALTVIGVLGLFRVETRASSVSRRETEAAVLAQDKLEELRTEAAPTTNVTGTDNPKDQLSGSTTFWSRSWTVAVTSDAAVYSIDVTVTWDDNGTTRSVTVHGRRSTS